MNESAMKIEVQVKTPFQIPVKITRMFPDVILPKYESEGAAAVDLRAYLGFCRDEGVTLNPSCTHQTPVFGGTTYVTKPGERFLFSTGIKMAIPEGWCGVLRFEKSGRGVKQQLHNVAGLIDSDYRGEIRVQLWNTGSEPVTIHHGDKIAQMVFLPIGQAIFEEVTELDETTRGENGFGSTGER